MSLIYIVVSYCHGCPGRDIICFISVIVEL